MPSNSISPAVTFAHGTNPGEGDPFEFRRHVRAGETVNSNS